MTQKYEKRKKNKCKFYIIFNYYIELKSCCKKLVLDYRKYKECLQFHNLQTCFSFVDAIKSRAKFRTGWNRFESIISLGYWVCWLSVSMKKILLPLDVTLCLSENNLGSLHVWSPTSALEWLLTLVWMIYACFTHCIFGGVLFFVLFCFFEKGW